MGLPASTIVDVHSVCAWGLLTNYHDAMMMEHFTSCTCIHICDVFKFV